MTRRATTSRILLAALLVAGPAVAQESSIPGLSTADPMVGTVTHQVAEHGLIKLPGTQPFQQGVAFGTPKGHLADDGAGFGGSTPCSTCHGNYNSAPRDAAAPEANGPYDTWRGSMMAQAWRDPLARAGIAVANKDLEDAIGVPAGDWCIRCHSPVGWLNHKSVPADGSLVAGSEAEGVSCAVCHRMRDAVAGTADCDPAKGDDSFDCGGENFSGRVLDYDNAMFLIDQGVDTTGDGVPNAERLFGPYEFSPALHEYGGGDNDFIRSSDHCGTCHNVTNPEIDVPTAAELEGSHPAHLATTHAAIAGTPMPVERTHAEWRASSFPSVGVSCQTCHMQPVRGYAAVGSPVERDEMPVHEMVGGNAWVPQMIPLFFPDQALPAAREALDRTSDLARQMLRAYVRVEVERFVDGLAVLRVVNETGHKLPTGYPEGRRMWLQVEGYAGDELVFESGHYDEATAELEELDSMGRPTKIWEILLGIYDRETRSAHHTFHFALNDVILQDNRIPPKGLRIAEAAAGGMLLVREPGACAAPLPAELQVGCEAFDWDGQDGIAENFDLVAYSLPPGVDRLKARLLYQTASKEYVEFLADPANSGKWTDRFVTGLLPAWEATGKSAPVEMAVLDTKR